MKNVKIVGNPIIKGKVRDDAEIVIPVPNELSELALSHDADDWDNM